MKKSVDNMNNWKDEQLSYFKKYIGEFVAGSREHSLLMEGIAQLESNKK